MRECVADRGCYGHSGIDLRRPCVHSTISYYDLYIFSLSLSLSIYRFSSDLAAMRRNLHTGHAFRTFSSQTLPPLDALPSLWRNTWKPFWEHLDPGQALERHWGVRFQSWLLIQSILDTSGLHLTGALLRFQEVRPKIRRAQSRNSSRRRSRGFLRHVHHFL